MMLGEARVMLGELPHPITEVSLPPFQPGLADALRPVFEAHGATLEERVGGCRVRFPEGTTMQRWWPVVHTNRYDVRLPDGYLLRYDVLWDGKTNLWFDPRDLPPEVRERFA